MKGTQNSLFPLIPQTPLAVVKVETNMSKHQRPNVPSALSKRFNWLLENDESALDNFHAINRKKTRRLRDGNTRIKCGGIGEPLSLFGLAKFFDVDWRFFLLDLEAPRFDLRSFQIRQAVNVLRKIGMKGPGGKSTYHDLRRLIVTKKIPAYTHPRAMYVTFRKEQYLDNLIAFADNAFAHDVALQVHGIDLDALITEHKNKPVKIDLSDGDGAADEIVISADKVTDKRGREPMPDKAKVRSKAIRTLRQSGYSDEDIRLVLDLGSAEDVESLLLPEIRDGFEDFVIRIRDDILRLASENGGQALSRFLTDLVTNEGTRLTLDEAKVVMACPISSFFSDKDLLLRASLKASSEMVRKI